MIALYEKALDQHFSQNEGYQELLERMNTGSYPLHLSGLRGNYLAALITRLQGLKRGRSLIVCPSENQARELMMDLELFHPRVHLFPWWGTMVYRGVAPQASIFGERVEALRVLLEEGDIIFVTSLRSFLAYLPPHEYFRSLQIFFEKGQALDTVALERTLQSYGYLRVPRVTVSGEFALRGEVLDIFPSGSDRALRLVFEFDAIDEIKYFDPQSQRTQEPLETFTLYPTKELVWTEPLLKALEDNFPPGAEATQTLRETGDFRGEELFFSLPFGEGRQGLLDYLDREDNLFFIDQEGSQMEEKTLRKEYGELYQQALERGLCVPEPDLLLAPLGKLLKEHRRSFFVHTLNQEGERETLGFPYQPGQSYLGNVNYLKGELEKAIAHKKNIFVFAESESQGERIAYMLREFKLTVIPRSISAGYTLMDGDLMVIQESEIFGRKKKIPSSVKRSNSEVIDSFVDLNPGDHVVHVNYGIGLFKGIERIKATGKERDYISLEYGGEEIIYLPIEQVNLIQRYIGNENSNPKLDRIGGSSWNNKKQRARRSVENLADRLITLYAKRETAVGYSFPKDDDFQVEFEASFPYEETPDQLRAIAEIKEDMESSRPMDRLVCGDVGYGKTEIAMRAAFKGVMGGKQVVFLCPTTILAEQHYENCLERFKRFPLRIVMLSRFVKRTDQKIVLQQIESGEADLIIGTHRILSKDLKFKKLGLLIVDEEQRFGVKHKERLKELKHNIDTLTLSATPIPRTLHMSLVKIRDMSTLKTPPRNRRPIETFVQEFDPDTVERAVRREVERGGQVFFLHNRVESLESLQLYIQRLVPEVMVETAHGKMSATELEDIMHRFIRGGFQVLLATTIIENGIDIPNVNTIIIDRADMYGISQLYQLRGRVGRSERLAYAYLLYPEQKALSELAMKRLRIISDFTDLGSGFKIAMKDMEVRGAGNLLGREQSGEILAVGFDMYLRLLEEAVEKRRGEQKEEPPELYLELDYSGFIPESYISDPGEKMEIYKSIASISEEIEQEEVYERLYDRYGPLPEEVESLLAMAEIRILCRKLWISSLKERQGLIYIDFAKVALVSVDKLMRLITQEGEGVRLDPVHPERIIVRSSHVDLIAKSEFLKEKLNRLL